MWWGGREALDLKKRNAAYQELCDAKAGSDKYVPRAAQTLNPATKDKGSHAVPPLTRSVKVSAEGFAIADAFREQVLWVGGWVLRGPAGGVFRGLVWQVVGQLSVGGRCFLNELASNR